jgi:ketosteroid isomerase-like protein
MPAEENIALIHRGLDAFSRGDFDAGVADMQPDVEWHLSFRLPDSRRLRQQGGRPRGRWPVGVAEALEAAVLLE